MKKVNNGIYKALSRIPPIFSKTTLRIVERDLKTFFKFPNRRYKYFLPLSFTYFTPEPENDFELSIEDQNQLESILSLSGTQAIIALSKNPTLCRAACLSTNVSSFTEFYSKDIFNEFVALTLYGQSIDLLNFILFKVSPPKPPLWPKPRFSKAIPWLLGPSDMPLFAPMKQKRFLILPSPIYKLNEKSKKAPNNTEKILSLSHPSAFAVSHNQLFFGLNNGTIKVEPYPPKNECSQSYTINVSNILSDRPYSLVWALDSLWVFTDTSCFCIDVITSSLSALKTNTTGYFPVFSDGYYFYSLTNTNRIVTVFTINRGQLKIIRKVRLEKPVDRFTPFITNGVFFTFADILENARIFIQFSAVNGSFIREFRCDFQMTEFSFCISPFRQHHLILTNYRFEAFLDHFQLPRWCLGLPFPESHLSDLNTVFNAVYYALYHDKKLFHDSRYDSVLEMAQNYVQLNDQYGVILSAMLLCHSQNRMPIEALNHYFMSCKSEARLFLCNVLLLCLSDKRIESYKNEWTIIKLPNIINTFIEEEYPPNFIWLFPKFFNFRRIELSSKGIIRLITYVTGQSSIFPDESFFIMSSFLRYAFANILNEPDKFIAPINAITISIEQKVISLNDKKGINDRYIKSTVDYKIWTELLLLIYQNRSNWIYFSSLFVKFFDFGLLNNRQYCGELNRMLNCTLYIFLSLFSNISLVIHPKFFNTLDEFFKEFPHTMNGVYISIDQKIFRLLSQCNDIPTKEEFSKYFFSLRNYFIFESPSISFPLVTNQNSKTISNSSMFCNSPSQAFDKLLNTLQDKQYSIKGVIKYIFENDPRELIQLQNQSIIEWFVLLFESRHLNDCQQCIFSIFLDTFEKIKPLLIEAVKAHSAYYFIKSFSYPFLFPPELFLNVSDITCNVHEIISYPLHLLRLSYKNIITCHQKITDSTMIVLPLINRLLKESDQDPVLLFDPSMEPVLYHDLILWMIGYKWGEIIDFRHYLYSFVVLLRNGSKREIRTTMKWIYIAEFFNDFNIDSLFHEMLDIIADYLLFSKNPFFFIKDPFDIAETVFTIVHYCKKLFNLQTDIFRRYLLKYIDINDKKTIIATFAILNNSIDLLRRNTHITVLDENFILINGKVREYKVIDESSNTFTNSNVVRIENKDKKVFEHVVLNKCVQMWATPKSIDLNLLFSGSKESSEKLCQKFQKIFSEVNFEYNYQNTFKLAALNTFIQLKFFRDSLSDDFKRSFLYLTENEWPNYYMMDRSYLDFSYFLTISHSSSASSKANNDTFCFSNDDENLMKKEQIEVVSFEDYGIEFEDDKKDEQEERILKGSQNLYALDQKVHFKSSPIHPRLHSKLSFTFDNSAFSVEIYGLSDINEYVLKYGPIITAADRNSQTIQDDADLDDESHSLLVIEMLPEKSMINVAISDHNNAKTKEINIFIPPLKMVYVALNLEPGTICSLEFEIDRKIVDFNEIDQNQFNSESLSNYCNKNENYFYDKMVIIKNEKVPIAPSSKNPGFFEFTSLEFAASNLNRTLKQLNAIQIMESLPSQAILNILFYSNPILSDKSLNFKKMISVPLWMTTAEKLRETVLRQLNREKLKEMESEIVRRKSVWPSVNIHHNQTFVFTKGYDEKICTDKIYRRVHYSNCFLMNDTRYIMLGLHDSKVHVYSGMVILPYLGINSTSLQIAINCRHLIACFRYLDVTQFDVNFFFDSIQFTDEKVSQSISAFNSSSGTSLALQPASSTPEIDTANSDINNAIIIATPDYVDYIGYNFLKSKTIKSISIFGEVKGLAELIFPQIPKEGEKPSFKEESLLIPESVVHNYPNIFFFHKYFELVSPRFHSQLFSCHSSPMYVTTTSENAGFEVNNRSFNASQFAILYNKSEQPSSSLHGIPVQRSFKVKSEDKNAEFICDALPNFSKIESEFKNWRSHHSFQLLLSLGSSAEVKMIYKKLPLSTKFSFEITYFMFNLLKKHKMKIKDKIEKFQSQINILVKSDSKSSQQNLKLAQSGNPESSSIISADSPKHNSNLNNNSILNTNSNLNGNAKLNSNANLNMYSSTIPNANLIPKASLVPNVNLHSNASMNASQNSHLNPHLNANIFPHVAPNGCHLGPSMSPYMNVNPYASQNASLSHAQYMQQQQQQSGQPSSSSQSLNANIQLSSNANSNSLLYSNLQLSTTQNSSSQLASNLQLSSNQTLKPPLLNQAANGDAQIQIQQQQLRVLQQVPVQLNPLTGSTQLVYQNSTPSMSNVVSPEVAANSGSPYLNAHPYSCSNLSDNSPANPYGNLNTNFKSNINLNDNPVGTTYSQLKQFISSSTSIDNDDASMSSSSINLPLQNAPLAETYSTLSSYMPKSKNAGSSQNDNSLKTAKSNSNEKLIPSVDISTKHKQAKDASALINSSNTNNNNKDTISNNTAKNTTTNKDSNNKNAVNNNNVTNNSSNNKNSVNNNKSTLNNNANNTTKNNTINNGNVNNGNVNNTINNGNVNNTINNSNVNNTINNGNVNNGNVDRVNNASNESAVNNANNSRNSSASSGSILRNDFIYPINIKRKGENAKFVHKINSSFKFAQELGEFSVNSKDRVDFLNGLRIPCTIFDRFDSHMVHIFTSFKESCQKVIEIKKDLSVYFRTQNMSQQSLSYLQKFVQTSPDFVVLLFIEFCTGESAISRWPIYVISVNNEGILRTSQEDHLLVIGKFQSYDSFSRKLLMLIQKAQDELVV